MTALPGRSSETRIGPAARAALQLLACCPRIPTDVASVLLGHRSTVTTAQLLARLRRAGLARSRAVRLGPLLGSRPVRLWTLTPAGQAALGKENVAPSDRDWGQLPYGEPESWRDPARQRDVPMLVAAYRLLAGVVIGLKRSVSVCAWEHPWVRALAPADGGRGRRVRLPAAAVLVSRQGAGEPPLRLLLLPDVGTAPLASYRPTLQALGELRQTLTMRDEDEPVLIVGVTTSSRLSSARVPAWQSLLQQVAARAGDRPQCARVLVPQTRLATDRGTDRRSAGQVDEVFALVARHPLVTRQQLAMLLGTSAARIARLEAELVERGWVRPIAFDDLLQSTDGMRGDPLRRLGLVELTAPGQQEAARRLLVPAGLARRRHGHVRGEDTRRRFLRHLHHTVGANAFFVDLAVAAMRTTRRGGDEALVDWRAAAACARGRCRPDGYGCYRRGPYHFGFFLEYDRGTERPGQHAAKLATYYRYRASGSYTRDYDGFPSLLVVTSNDDAEARFAHQAYLAQQQHDGAPLRLFLTTTSRIQAHPSGGLGPVWRGPGPPWAAERAARVSWLPSLPLASRAGQ